MPKRFNVTIEKDIWECEYDFEKRSLEAWLDSRGGIDAEQISDFLVPSRKDSGPPHYREIIASSTGLVPRRLWINAMEHLGVENEEITMTVPEFAPTQNNVPARTTSNQISADAVIRVQRVVILQLQQMFGLTNATEAILAVVQGAIDTAEESYREWTA